MVRSSRDLSLLWGELVVGSGRAFMYPVYKDTYAPRIHVPVLMVNGRFDPDLPFEASQHPLFELLGSAEGREPHVVVESGHALSMEAVTGEILPWLDRTLGPVAR